MTELIKVDEKRYAEPIILDNNIILPGQEETVRLSAGRLPSDNRLYIYAHVSYQVCKIRVTVSVICILRCWGQMRVP